ncbi:MAG: hypothetical protein WCG47_10045 [Dermatophilaceae bacterium]
MIRLRDLGVPALYAVYFGGLGYRANWPCEEDPPGCEDCAGLTINMVPLLTYSSSPTTTDAADLACTYGTPLEKLSGIKTWWRSLPFAGTPLADVRSGRSAVLSAAAAGVRLAYPVAGWVAPDWGLGPSRAGLKPDTILSRIAAYPPTGLRKSEPARRSRDDPCSL